MPSTATVASGTDDAGTSARAAARGAARGGFFCSRPNFWTSCRPTRSASPSPTGPSSRPRSPRTRAEPAEARARPRRPREVPTRGRGSRAGGHRRTDASASPRDRMRSGEPGAMLTPRGRKPAARRPRGARRSTPRATWSRTHRQVRGHKMWPGKKSQISVSIFSRNGRRCLFPLAAACAPYRVARAPDAYRGGFSREGERIDTREAQEPRGALERRGRRLRSSLVVATECL